MLLKSHICKRLKIGVGTIVLALTIGQAHAEVLFNSFYPNDISAFPSPFVGRNDAADLSQSVAAAFTLTSDATITDLLLAMQGSGNVRLGVQANAVVNGLNVPSSSFLYSTVLVNPVLNADVGGLDWSLSAGRFWLVGLAETNGTSTSWSSGLFGDTAYSIRNGPWFYADGGGRAVRINGVFAPVPEAPAWAMALAGLAVAVRLLRRQAR